MRTIQEVIRELDENDNDVDKQEQIMLDYVQEILDVYTYRYDKEEVTMSDNIVKKIMKDVNPTA